VRRRADVAAVARCDGRTLSVRLPCPCVTAVTVTALADSDFPNGLAPPWAPIDPTDGNATLPPNATFGKRTAPPAVAGPPPIELTIPSPRPNLRAVPPPRDRPPSRTHYFTQESNPSSLGVLEREIGESVESGAGQITIAVTSPGGLLLPMLEFYQRLIALPVKIRTHAVGPVASAGTILMLAGSERSAVPDATFLFHPVSSHAQQRVTGLQARSIERHRQLYELTLHEIYKARTRLSLETIARFGEETLVFDAQSAVRWGIIDRIEVLTLGR
jgi:ATP-dependent protease ClpP protease subunit